MALYYYNKLITIPRQVLVPRVPYDYLLLQKCCLRLFASVGTSHSLTLLWLFKVTQTDATQTDVSHHPGFPTVFSRQVTGDTLIPTFTETGALYRNNRESITTCIGLLRVKTASLQTTLDELEDSITSLEDKHKANLQRQKTIATIPETWGDSYYERSVAHNEMRDNFFNLANAMKKLVAESGDEMFREWMYRDEVFRLRDAAKEHLQWLLSYQESYARWAKDEGLDKDYRTGLEMIMDGSSDDDKIPPYTYDGIYHNMGDIFSKGYFSKNTGDSWSGGRKDLQTVVEELC